MMEEQKQKTLETLECYQLARQVLKEAYALAKQLPNLEKYNLCDQIRRAATSGVLNIAEGYGRYHYLDRIRFLYNARGSLTEVLGAIEASETLEYIDRSECERLQELVNSALRSLNGFIRHIRKTQRGQREFGNRVVQEDIPAYVIVADNN